MFGAGPFAGAREHGVTGSALLAFALGWAMLAVLSELDEPAGRGWSESASAPQDGVQVATDLQALLERAGEPGPYVLAGHSTGGIYALNFARLFPQQVAGVVLLG
jgi:pimeloyl-ACP methyl ester carboxylesterase